MPLVFGYGSLVEGLARPAVLPGWRRTWGVAMDNAVDLPGYKHYERPGTGERPAVYVAFLDIEPDPAGAVPGAVIEVADDAIPRLEERERNYARVVVETSAGPAIAFAGLPAARERRRRGVAEDRCVVPHEYVELVRAGFAALTPGGDAEFDATTGPFPGPVVELRRVDH